MIVFTYLVALDIDMALSYALAYVAIGALKVVVYHL